MWSTCETNEPQLSKSLQIELLWEHLGFILASGGTQVGQNRIAYGDLEN